MPAPLHHLEQRWAEIVPVLACIVSELLGLSSGFRKTSQLVSLLSHLLVGREHQLCSLGRQIIGPLWEGGEENTVQLICDYSVSSKITKNCLGEFDKAAVGWGFRKRLIPSSVWESAGVLQSSLNAEHMLLKFLTQLQKHMSIFVLGSEFLPDQLIVIAAQVKESYEPAHTRAHPHSHMHTQF